MLKKYTTKKVLQYLEGIEKGCLSVMTPDGKVYEFSGREPGGNVGLHLHDWSVFSRIIKKGDIGLAETYREGLWSTSNLTGLFLLAMTNRKKIGGLTFGSRLFSVKERLSYFLRLNTHKGSKKNIHAHYDLGNEFYSLWLDPSMTYSSAIFHNDQETLQQGQLNKYQRIIDNLETSSGEVLEVGCGWGGFAEHAMQQGNYSIKGITLSQQQHEYAKQRLNKSANIVLEDYRDQKGKFDHIVSIEMFEAVGERYWQTYFEKISSLMKDKGKAVIQTITINEESFPSYRRGSDFIRSYIFPGGMLPCPTVFKQQAKKASLVTKNEYFFGQDYATTLEGWLDNFENKTEQVKRLGFDEGFIRLWRFYLAACIAGFKIEHTNVMQVELVHE
ncbi:MAG: class I SAM-dependent methyltransferase [Gammaproteobacteria bacterium]